ncbi:uncharacterized protein EI97DRAFT_438956 [Westerdykella ornata]|uniref:Uncharacterized protein n=1 Tax=Westerdykella ornata TaxID=318751 RepID=A0A6A6JTB3_WESOR|nr:uncharacterized protein EI97DRAFT_438956 [Westerdykella ornata]KAF2279851.1 hypothetical protein EI97DRAFT_438956 [Westerdykella ornata]
MQLTLLITTALGLTAGASESQARRMAGWYSAKPPDDHILRDALYDDLGCNEARWPTYWLYVRPGAQCRFYGAPGCPQNSFRLHILGPWGPTTDLAVGPGGIGGVTHYTCWYMHKGAADQGYEGIANSTITEDGNNKNDTSGDEVHESLDTTT